MYKKKSISLIKNNPYIVSSHLWPQIKTEIETILQKENIKRVIFLPDEIQKHLIESFDDNGYEIEIITRCIALGIIGWTIWTNMDTFRDELHVSKNHLALFSVLRPVFDSIIHELNLSKKGSTYLLKKIGVMEYANSPACKIQYEKQMILKSIAVCIPSLTLLMKTGVNQINITSCYHYFYHFIGARQLSDDALDWQEDMKKVQPTLVTQWLEQAVGKNRTIREYKKAFNTKVSPRVAKTILEHARKSIRYAQKMTCFTSTEFLEELPRFYENMALGILNEYKIVDKDRLKISRQRRKNK